jgi:L-Ala-D/L-Glu epimerase
MHIQHVEVMRQSIPLIKPFKTALRTVHFAESVLVRITADNGKIGWGEAPATIAITGDSLDSIHSAIQHTFTPLLVGGNLLAYEQVLQSVYRSMVGNSSAKAAVDMAIYDLVAQHAGLPLYQFLGGYKDSIETDFTVSVN